MTKRSHLDLILIVAVLLVVFAIGFGLARLTTITGAQRDFQIHSANGALFMFNARPDNCGASSGNLTMATQFPAFSPVSYYDATASAALREQLDAETAKHQKLDPSNFPDQPSKPPMDFPAVAIPSAAPPTVPKAKPVKH